MQGKIPVGFLKKIAQRLLLIVQFILVFLFILFEEIIWEGIAQPIYEHIASLRILQKIEQGIHYLPRSLVLVLFVSLLLGVEGAGLFAGVLFVQGYVLFGLLLYITKIPIAAFTFWLFKVSKDKLLSFEWFAWLYDRVMKGIAWLKEREIYQESMAMMRGLKAKIKSIILQIKQRFFTKESRFMRELKTFYRYLKNFKNRKNR